ncbi:hypothetical protein GUJ93_ZPchr0010g10289 [Zizania palustris]|uniref:Uncharacterized protein n=1 Tax=Zizania palustris TaxID=103762 RepID=A0A8J5WFE6_ZIZPA|nr:hypothetical protein GUJ93_ZPchr0010g10289 [Zizania palustris]
MSSVAMCRAVHRFGRSTNKKRGKKNAPPLGCEEEMSRRRRDLLRDPNPMEALVTMRREERGVVVAGLLVFAQAAAA